MDGEEFHDFSWAAPSRFSRTLLSPKLFKIFFHASHTALIPFLPMYFRFLGLTAFQSGILGSLRSLMSCWSSFLWCIVSEKIAKRKCFLVLLLLTGIVLNASLSFVQNPNADFMNYYCSSESMYKNNSLNLTRNGATDVHNSSNNFVNKAKRAVYLMDKMNDTDDKDIQLALRRPTVKREVEEVEYAFGFRFDALFRNLLLVTACAEIFMSPVRTIMDSIFADFLHFSKGSIGHSKAWTFLGDLFGAGLVVLIIAHFQCAFSLTNAFYLHFYLFSILGAFAFIFASLLHVYEPKTSMNYRFGRTCNYICCNIQALSIILVMFALGMAESLMSNFMMWYLGDIDASIMVMGLMIAIGVFSELVMLGITKYIIQCCGYNVIYAIALLAYGGHFLAFSYIRNQWYILPVQLLQGLSMATIWTATSAYCADVAPIGMERTLNGIISISYWGFGHGLGGIGTALLYYQYGPVVVFRCAAGICVIYMMLFVLLQCMIKMPEVGHKGRNMNGYHQIVYDERMCRINHQGDWLLEALGDEEDEYFSR